MGSIAVGQRRGDEACSVCVCPQDGSTLISSKINYYLLLFIYFVVPVLSTLALMSVCELVSISPSCEATTDCRAPCRDDPSCVLHNLPKSCSGWTDPSDEGSVSQLGNSVRGNSVGLFVSVPCVPAGINVL